MKRFTETEFAPPTVPAMLLSFTAAVARFVAAGLPVASEAQFRERLAVCQGDGDKARCRHWNGSRCLACGCIKIKLHLATERCPLGKWLTPDLKRG